MKFTRISGIVSDLLISKKYENLLFTKQQSNLLGIGAVGAAIFGEGLSSTIMAGASEGAELEMEYFTCMVAGAELSGRFYKVEFKNGQAIDFAVDESCEVRDVHAALDPLRRLVWTLPYRTKGHIAQLKSNIIGCIATSISAGIISFLLGYYDEDDGPLRWKQAFIMGSIGFIMVLIVSYRACRRVFGNCFEATLAFEALGFNSPANLNLPKGHSTAEKRYAKETGEPEQPSEPWRFRFDQCFLKNI